MSAQLLVHLPEELARRFRRAVAPCERSKFIAQLLEQALPSSADDNDALYRAALAAEQVERLSAEMAEWEEAMLGVSLDPRPSDDVNR